MEGAPKSQAAHSQPKVPFKRAYLILIAFTLGLALAYFLDPFERPWASDISLALWTNLLAALIIIQFVDQVLERARRAELERRRDVAFLRLHGPLRRHFNFLFHLFVATAPARPARQINEPCDLFDHDFYEHVAELNASSDAPVAENYPWHRHISDNVVEFANELEKVLDLYAQFLDAETIGALDRFHQSVLLLVSVRYFPELIKDSRTWMIGPTVSESLKLNYIEDFCKLLAIFNKVVPADRRIAFSQNRWDQRGTPQIGSARFPPGFLWSLAHDEKPERGSEVE